VGKETPKGNETSSGEGSVVPREVRGEDLPTYKRGYLSVVHVSIKYHLSAPAWQNRYAKPP